MTYIGGKIDKKLDKSVNEGEGRGDTYFAHL